MIEPFAKRIALIRVLGSSPMLSDFKRKREIYVFNSKS
nr:MAG TPA: hypothetical protein [Caudoviricetes sp.]